MKILIDTNILLDVLARRDPFYEAGKKLIAFGSLGEYEMWIGLSQITDVFYILSEGGKPALADTGKRKLRILRKHIHVCSIGEQEVDAALRSTWPDFEDACVHQSALYVGADCIVTRNTADFERSGVPAYTVEGFFDMLEEDHGLLCGEIDFPA